MKKTFARVISTLLLAVMIFHIPFLGTTPNVDTGIDVCSDLEEDIFDE